MRVVLYRYANRKVYRPGVGTVYGYCNFAVILKMIREGTDVVIYDKRTKCDLTTEILNNLNHQMFPMSKEELLTRFRGGAQ